MSMELSDSGLHQAAGMKHTFGYKIVLRDINNVRRFVLMEECDGVEMPLAICFGKEFSAFHPDWYLPSSQVPQLTEALAEHLPTLIVEKPPRPLIEKGGVDKKSSL